MHSLCLRFVLEQDVSVSVPVFLFPRCPAVASRTQNLSLRYTMSNSERVNSPVESAHPKLMSVADAHRRQSLEDDLYNALCYLFEGAIAWDAWKRTTEKAAGEKPSSTVILRHQGVLGMYTAFMEARALYEFFHKHGRRGHDDARADDFASEWKANQTDVYKNYMAAEKPANKRMFHLVYGRSEHSGGTGTEGIDHLKEQVLNVAKDLRDLTDEFNKHIDDSGFREVAETALRKALDEAQKAADHYRIANPL